MIRKIFVLLLCSAAFAAPICEHRLDSDALSALAQTLDIPPGEDLVAATQERWLRKPGQERWEMNEVSPEKRLFVLKWAEENGLFSSWLPSEPFYDQGLILGATTPRMETRLAFLADLWKGGTRFGGIVWLTGERSLDPRGDGLIGRAKTESEAARILWEEANLPEEMRSLPVFFIAVPMKENGRRPNTADTIEAWLEEFPEPCTGLFISDQPFCGYQFAIIRSLVPDAYLFDVAGERVRSTDHPAAGAIVLDSIARWLYQESINSL